MFYIPWERELMAKEVLLLKPPLELPIKIQLLVEKEQVRQDLEKDPKSR